MSVETPAKRPGIDSLKVRYAVGVVAVSSWFAMGLAVDRSETTIETTTDRPPATEPSETVGETPETSPPTAPSTADETTTAGSMVSETTAVASPIPSGALALGFGTYLAVPAGYAVSGPTDGVTTLSDGTVSIALKVMARPPGESASTLLQEYVDVFDSAFERIAYSPVYFWGESGDVPVASHGVRYATYDSAVGIGLWGQIVALQRGDGLSAIVEQWTTGDGPSGLPDRVDALMESMSLAPLLGEPVVDLVWLESFRLSTVHPFIEVDGLKGFTPAPGFTVSAGGGGSGLAISESGPFNFNAQTLTATNSIDEAVQAAQTALTSVYPTIMLDETQVDENLSDGRERRWFTWRAADGRVYPNGFCTVVFDAGSGTGEMVAGTWFGEFQYEDGADVFMYNSFISLR